MINKVELGNVNSKKSFAPKKRANTNSVSKNPSFTGLGSDIFAKIGSGLLSVVQKCEEKPMVNVAVLDLTTAIVPRTIYETTHASSTPDDKGERKRKLNIIGGFEAFRRESSGLIINCLIPGFIVTGVAKLLNRPVMGGFKKSNLSGSWANGATLDKISGYYKDSKATTQKEKIYDAIDRMVKDIHGVDGKELKSFKTILGNNPEEYKSALNTFVDNIVSDKPNKNYANNFYKFLVDKTGISENIKFADNKSFFSSSLSHLCESAGDFFHGVSKEGIEDIEKLTKYVDKNKKLVNLKSGIGLVALIMPLAVLAQPINRWITHKMSGKSGAPIYNDDKDRTLSPEEKTKLNAQKCIAAPLMAGVAGLSMLLDRPSLGMFQFKNIFPTMDQARVISATTFISRILSSEDSNELKEVTIRDIATFSSFYFLGDYAAKGIASLLQKFNKDVTLINVLEKTPENANIFKKFWYWAKHTNMKSSDELSAITNAALKSKSLKLRALCQLGNIACSLIALGWFIPAYTRAQTNKKQAELAAKAENQKKVINDSIPQLDKDRSLAFKAILEKK